MWGVMLVKYRNEGNDGDMGKTKGCTQRVTISVINGCEEREREKVHYSSGIMRGYLCNTSCFRSIIQSFRLLIFGFLSYCTRFQNPIKQVQGYRVQCKVIEVQSASIHKKMKN